MNNISNTPMNIQNTTLISPNRAENKASAKPEASPTPDGFEKSPQIDSGILQKVSFDVSEPKIAQVNISELAEGAVASGTSVAAAASAPPAAGLALSTVKVLYTNDIHGAILPSADRDNPKIMNGGMSQLSSVIMDIEKKDGDTLLLDGGDWAQGTYLGGFDQGQTMMKLMSTIGYDGAIIGNHDFDWGQEALQKMIDVASFPVLGANIIEEGTGNILPGVQPSFIKEVNGVKIGVIGVTSEKTKSETAAPNTEGLKFANAAQTVKKQIPELKKQGADLIMVLSHQGMVNDERLAKEVPGIDVIVGGHSHTKLNSGKQVGDTIIVQSGSRALGLGELELVVDTEKNKVVSFNNQIIPITSQNAKPDPKVEAVLAPFMEEANKVMNEVVGETSIRLTRNRSKTPETILGNMVTDGMRKAGNAELAFVNSGGIRAEIDAGPITFGEIYQVIPFDQQLVTMDLTGNQVLELMEKSAERSRGTLEVSGLTADIDPKKKVGNRVSNLQIGGQPVEPNRLYKVAVDDFFAAGGNNYTTFLEGQNVELLSITSRDAFKNFVADGSPFSEKNARVEGRMNYLSAPPQSKPNKTAEVESH